MAMKILLLSNRIPYPPHDGGAIAIYNMIEGLKSTGWDVHLFSLNTRKHFFNPEEVPSQWLTQEKLTTVYADTNVKPLPAFFNLFGRKSYNISRFYTREAEEHLAGLLKKEKFDAIQVEGIFMTPYLSLIRKHSNAPVILRAHNVEYMIWERMAKGAFFPKNWYLQLLARRLKKYEKNHFPEFDAIAAITPEDAERISSIAPESKVFHLPAGIDLAAFSSQNTEKEEPGCIFHLGALDWMPNQEGVTWFIEKVWPFITQKMPGTKFYIAGRHIPGSFYKYENDQISVLGEIPNAAEFMSQKGIMVVPLLSGSGMRIKIIEGMALSKAIVSTNIGAEGIDCRHGENILISDKPYEFAQNVLSLLKDPDLKYRISRNARKKAEEKYSKEAVANTLTAFYKRELL